MIKYQNLLSELDEFRNEKLPPRSLDPLVLLSILDKKPIKITYGFCGMCDSTMRDQWTFEWNDGCNYDLYHLVNYCKLLRISEYNILKEYLEEEYLKNLELAKLAKSASLSHKILNFLRKLFGY